MFLGIVADDFTGASDAASFLAEAGVSTVLFNGIPKQSLDLREGAEAVVIALKSRTAPVKEAVRESLAAFAWLKQMGAEQLYLKYCSTFDSTPEGNIGPVTDAVMEQYGYEKTVLCPALPVNGRTVKQGILYVNGVPLAESAMRDHPLTPMRQSRIAQLMKPQGKYPCVEIGVGEEVPEAAKKYYLIPDYYEETHGDRIAEQFGDLPFLTGGSGLVGALGRRYVKRQKKDPAAIGRSYPGVTGKAVLLAGSCSAVTLKQIDDYEKKGYPLYRIRPAELLSGVQNQDQIWQWILEEGTDGLVYSSSKPEDLRKSQELGRERVASAIEQLLAGLARQVVEAGYTRVIVAGGETSGAVTKALGYDAFYIGPSVAPGVPVMIPVANPELRLVLKSGNFGQEDFFKRALQMTCSSS